MWEGVDVNKNGDILKTIILFIIKWKLKYTFYNKNIIRNMSSHSGEKY